MEFINIQFVIALPIGGIIGWIIREIVSDRLARERGFEAIKITEFNKAASVFRSAFTKEISLVEESTIDTDFAEIFNNAYIRHRNAIIRFKPYISETERIGIEKAWNNHCYPHELDEYDRTLPSAKFIHYDHRQVVEKIDGKPVISEEHEVSFGRAKRLAEKNIEHLLSFAKLK